MALRRHESAEDQIRALAKHPEIRAQVRQEIEPTIIAKAKATTEGEQSHFVAQTSSGGFIGVGPTYAAAESKAKRYCYQHGGSAFVETYSAAGDFVSRRQALTGVRRPRK